MVDAELPIEEAITENLFKQVGDSRYKHDLAKEGLEKARAKDDQDLEKFYQASMKNSVGDENSALEAVATINRAVAPPEEVFKREAPHYVQSKIKQIRQKLKGLASSSK